MEWYKTMYPKEINPRLMPIVGTYLYEDGSCLGSSSQSDSGRLRTTRYAYRGLDAYKAPR
jgi:hypothetical protein